MPAFDNDLDHDFVPTMHASDKTQWRIKHVSPSLSRYAARRASAREASLQLELKKEQKAKQQTKQRRFDRANKCDNAL